MRVGIQSHAHAYIKQQAKKSEQGQLKAVRQTSLKALSKQGVSESVIILTKGVIEKGRNSPGRKSKKKKTQKNWRVSGNTRSTRRTTRWKSRHISRLRGICVFVCMMVAHVGHRLFLRV